MGTGATSCVIGQELRAVWLVLYRSNLIANLHRQYVTSGYIWEQYDDKTGQGKVGSKFWLPSKIFDQNLTAQYYILCQCV